MKLTTMTQVTIDGVIRETAPRRMTAGTDSSAADGPGGKGDDETRTFITQTYQRAAALLFGRRTHELFAAPGDQSTRCAHIASAWP